MFQDGLVVYWLLSGAACLVMAGYRFWCKDRAQAFVWLGGSILFVTLAKVGA